MFDIENPVDFLEDNNDFDYKKFIVKSASINKEISDFVTGRIAQGLHLV